MIPQPAPNIASWLFGIVLLSIGLEGCDSGSSDQKSVEANAMGSQSDSLETLAAKPMGEVYTHPYLIKADEIRNKEGFTNAIPYYEAAVSLFEKDGNWEGLISAKNRVSSYYADRSYYDISYYDSLLINLENTWELGKKYLESTSLSFSEIQYWFGKYFEETNEPYQSISFHQKALNNRVKQLGNNNLSVAESLKALGDVYFYQLSDYNNAENFYEKSVDIKSQLLDSANVDLIRGYYSMARVKRLNDDTESAINYGLKALKIAMMNPIENKQRIGLCHNVLANIYNDKNDYKNAELHYQKAIEISKAKFGENNHDLPIYYNGLGTIFLQQKELGLAKSYFTQSLHINELYFPDDLDEIADNFTSLGLVYTQLKLYDSALIYFNKSLEIKLKQFGTKNARTGLIYEFLGDMYADKGHLEMALQHYQNALISIVENFNENDVFVNPKFSSQVHGFRFVHVIISKALLLKRCYHESHNIKYLEASLKTYLLANKIIDRKRNNDITEESRLVLIENHFQDQMENGIDCAFLLYQLTGKPEFQNTAFQLIEKTKYMLLFESLIKNKKNQQFGVPDSLLALEKNLKVEMAFFKQNLDELLQDENLNQQQVDRLQNKVFSTAVKQEKLYKKLKDEYPRYYDIKFDSVTLSIKDIQKALKNRGVEIIEFYYGKKNIYILSISNEIIKFQRLEKSQLLENAITTYLEQISSSPDITSLENYRRFCQSASQLYELLMKPILTKDSLNKNLVIIPHGRLSVLPFESIIKPVADYNKVDYKNLSYLIKDHQFSYAYSANLLFKTKTKQQAISKPKILAFSYSNEFHKPKNRDEIIGSSKEINTISKFVKGTFYKGQYATESTFKSTASQFDILHLAVHGRADDESKLSNRLLFKNELDSTNDGVLHSYEVLNLNIDAKLVVLSACETGLGQQFKGEGIFSMARSFAYAGCEAIIMSYWKAKDNATADIMGSFYKYLVDGATVDKALRKAKISFINESEELTAHPSAWAAFVPFGDMSTPIFQNQNASAEVLGYFFLISVITLILWYMAKNKAFK